MAAAVTIVAVLGVGLAWGGGQLWALGANAGSGAATEVRFIPSPKGYSFLTPLWVASHRELVVSMETPENRPISTYLYRLDLASGRPTALGLKRDARCPYKSAEHEQLARSSTLVFIRRCYGGNGDPSQFAEVDSVRVGQRSPTRWRPYFLRPLTNALAVSPDGKQAIVNDGSGWCSKLRWLLPHRMSVPIKFAATASSDVAWSPDGTMVAATGAESCDGYGSPNVADIPEKVFLLDTAGHVRRVLLHSLRDSGEVAWSPDSQTVALVTSPSGQPTGLYALDVKTGASRLLFKSDWGYPTWIGDGRIALAVPRPSAGESLRTAPGLHIYAFDRHTLFTN